MMCSIYSDLGITALDSERAVVRAAAGMLPVWVRRDPCRRLLRRKFYCEMLRCHAEAQSGIWQTWH